MSDIAYQLASTIYKQGIECDVAASLIRKTWPEFEQGIKEATQERMRQKGQSYDKSYER